MVNYKSDFCFYGNLTLDVKPYVVYSKEIFLYNKLTSESKASSNLQ